MAHTSEAALDEAPAVLLKAVKDFEPRPESMVEHRLKPGANNRP
jgi:hypothetical protein